MKFNLFFKKINYRIIGLILILIFFSLLAKANIEEDLKDITSKLRCMTCQNQNIYSSDAEFSINIKKIVREKLNNSESEKEIIDFLVFRYGEYIVFEPQMNKQNIFLWIFPFIISAISLVFFIFLIRKQR
tara:strand:+ start:1197 stop:1586 length:390 start_codon:yes stop_codon:yes gene_type:complete